MRTECDKRILLLASRSASQRHCSVSSSIVFSIRYLIRSLLSVVGVTRIEINSKCNQVIRTTPLEQDLDFAD